MTRDHTVTTTPDQIAEMEYEGQAQEPVTMPTDVPSDRDDDARTSGAVTLRTLYERIDDIGIAMMTTRRADGHLRARPMATQRAAAGADLWFVTKQGSRVLDEVAADAHVNLAYLRASNTEWVSVSGMAILSQDRPTIHTLYAPDWSMWFGQEGDPRHGTGDDPRIMLVGVTVHAAEFLQVDASRPVLLYEMAKGWVTGTAPDVGEMHRLREPHRPRS